MRTLPASAVAELLSENSACLCSCQANHLEAGRSGTKGRCGFSSSGCKSPSEEAIIYLITLTIPLWTPIQFSPMNSCSGAARRAAAFPAALSPGTHPREPLFPLEAGAAHARERGLEAAVPDAGNLPLMVTAPEALRGPLFAEGDLGGSDGCLPGGGDSYSVKTVLGLEPLLG